MIVKLFGLGDILAAITLALLAFGFSSTWYFIPAAYLFIKGIVFFFDFASILDILSAVLIAVGVLGYSHWFFLGFAVWLFQKGVRSLF